MRNNPNYLIHEFRNTEKAQKMADILSKYDGKPVTIMEVCGTHTMAIFRYGIRDLLPSNVRLISGPGCPVCVTPSYYIASAIELAKREDVIITTFGDLMRVPGGNSSLLMEKAAGRDVRIVYSPLDSLKIASDNPDKKVVFLSIGFETTTPVAALTVIKAKEEGIRNFSILSANKTVPNALRVLSADEDIGVNGYLYPGHVSAIIGTGFYDTIANEYGITGVVAGFEPLDMLRAIITIISNSNSGRTVVENQYSRVVPIEGNPIAVEKMYEVFEPADAVWRGIGCIPGSGLKMRNKYREYDSWEAFELQELPGEEPKGCMCGEILKGKLTPKQCKLFGKVCTPENPVGACMVSSEGTCAAYHKYGGENV
ncbi:MAG: hydrogenase formation protein HypD [Clostridiales bacterium]|jgi:hydrogenase expression/formation protein HypD|nr:hydrogenase formation protein HypD [Clostridiales bacterium]